MSRCQWGGEIDVPLSRVNLSRVEGYPNIWWVCPTCKEKLVEKLGTHIQVLPKKEGD